VDIVAAVHRSIGRSRVAAFPVVLRRVRRGGLALLGVVACSGTGACALIQPSETEVYLLTLINGLPLPAPLITAVAEDGSTYEFQAVNGSITLYSNGRLEKRLEVRDVHNGVPEGEIKRSRWSGSYERNDTSVVIRFPLVPEGVMRTYSYRLDDGGTTLVGIEGDFRFNLYTYIRD